MHRRDFLKTAGAGLGTLALPIHGRAVELEASIPNRDGVFAITLANPVEVNPGLRSSMAITTLTVPASGVILVWVFSAAVPTGCSDPTNGTYTQLDQVVTSSRWITVYGINAVSGTPTITVTCGSALLIAIMGDYFTGCTIDGHNSHDNNFVGSPGGANSVAGCTTPITTTGLDTVVALFANLSGPPINGTGALTAGSGYTKLTTTVKTNNTNPWLLEYIVQTAAGAINPPATVNGQSDVAAVTVALKPISSAGAWDGQIAINSSGLMVNGAGKPIQLRGSNFTGPEGQILNGHQSNMWGTLGGYGGPSWPTYASWKSNVVRIPLNVACFLNLNMGVLTGNSPTAAAWSGIQVAGDPDLVYRAQIIDAINNARTIGCYVILEAHWSAPAFTLGGTTNYMGAWDQPMFMDFDTTYPFWTAAIGAGPVDATGGASTGLVAFLQNNFGPGGPHHNSAIGGSSGINDIIFELFNEPYFDQANCNFNTAKNGTGTAQTSLQVMKGGGWCSSYRNQFDNGTGNGGIGCPNAYCGAIGTGQSGITNVDTYGFNYWWRVAGIQQVVTGIRALNATNVIVYSTLAFSKTLSEASALYPTDTMSPPQIGVAMHPYQNAAGSNYPITGDSGSGTATWDTYVNQTLAGTGGIGHAIPVLLTEYGNTRSTGSGVAAAQPDPYMVYMQNWMDGKTTGAVGGMSWAWNNFEAGSPSPANYGYNGTTSWTECINSAPISFTGSTSGNTLTVTAGNGLSAGTVFSGGSVDRAYISKQLTGTAGGAGTYLISYSVTQGGTTFTGNNWLPLNGQGQTRHDWTVNHS
jgi:hypothetical protein